MGVVVTFRSRVRGAGVEGVVLSGHRCGIPVRDGSAREGAFFFQQQMANGTRKNEDRSTSCSGNSVPGVHDLTALVPPGDGSCVVRTVYLVMMTIGLNWMGRGGARVRFMLRKSASEPIDLSIPEASIT